MKPKLTFRVWSGGGLLLALVFVIWAVFLIVTVRRHPPDAAELTGFVLLSGILVLGGAVLLAMCRRSLLQVAQQDGVLERTRHELEQRVDERTAALAREVAERHRIEHELRGSEKRFRALLEHSSDVVLILQPDGTIVFNEPRQGRILGYTNEGFLGRGAFDLVHPDDQPMARSLLAAVPQSTEPHWVRFRARHRDGSWRWLEAVVVNLLHEPSVAGIVVNYRDITERKQAEDALRKAHDELDLKVRERTAELLTANAALRVEIDQHRRTEEALRDSEALYHSLVENLPMNIYRKDREGRILFANQEWCKTRGRPLAQLLGKTVYELFPVSLAEMYARDDQELLRTGREYHTVEEHQTGRGERIHVEVFKTAVRDHRGRVVGTQGAFWDVTERKRAEEALAQERLLLRTLINHLPDYIYVKDAVSRFLLNNPAHLRVLGAGAQEEVLGKTDFDYFSAALARAYYDDEQRVIQTGQPLLEREEYTVGAAGESQWVLTTKVPLRNTWGQVTGLVGISRDITRLKQGEEKLRRAHEELERRVEERTAELASSNADLARSNAELAQFASIASHDLQEPLRAVAGCVTLLQQHLGEQLDARAAEYMRHAVEGATRMQALIHDLLVYSRVGTHGQTPEDADCAAVLRGVLADLDPAIRESGARVTHDSLPVVAADPTQLQQLFQNLLSNAVKFRGTRPPVIHVGARAENGCWHFTVSDNGIGIEPRYFERIFRVFQRLHTRREYAGTGIGLAICKKIVERHGGHIWVESTPGRSSIFHFTFPSRR